MKQQQSAYQYLTILLNYCIKHSIRALNPSIRVYKLQKKDILTSKIHKIVCVELGIPCRIIPQIQKLKYLNKLLKIVLENSNFRKTSKQVR